LVRNTMAILRKNRSQPERRSVEYLEVPAHRKHPLCPLFSTAAIARALEAAYLGMIESSGQ
jgi:hypothetical protein